jgi:hypothetical protein
VSKVLLATVIIAAGFVLAGGVYLAAPALQSGDAVAESDLTQATERARRLLNQFGDNEERLETVIEALRLAGVDDSDNERINELPELDREMFRDAEERLRQISREQGLRIQQLLSQSRVGEEMTPVPSSGSFGSNVPSMSEAIRKGMQARDALMARNEQLLSEALNAVKEGLDNVGDADAGRSHAMALNVKGMIEYHQGNAAYRQARVLRDRAQAPRVRLQMLAAAIGRDVTHQGIVSQSGIEAKISEVASALSGQQGQVEAFDQKIAGLESRIAEMQARLEEQQSIAEQARQELDALANRGAELDRGDGYERFAVQYGAQSKVYREALKQIQVLEFGTLANAAIDQSGDFVAGKYVPANGSGEIEPKRGLLHLNAELEALKHQREDAAEVVASLQEHLEAMKNEKTALVQAGADAESRARERAETAAEWFGHITEIVDQARQLEEQAIAKLNAAAQSFDDAARQSQTVQNEYREATSALGPQEQERSAKSLFANDVRPAASNSARAADARLRLAMVYYDRLRDLKRDKAIVEELAGHVGELPDPAALEAEIEETQSTGLALAEQATDKLLREARNLEQHYSVTAEIAAGYYLQSLFGNPELAEAAIRNYQTVIEGREDDPNVQAFVQRLAQLQNK